SAAVGGAVRREMVVWIDVALEAAWRRTRGSGRRLARDGGEFAGVYARREPIYASLADITVPCERSGTMAAILRAASDLPARTKMLWAAASSGDYPAYIGADLLERGFWPPDVDGRRFLVSDGAVG